MKKIHIYIIVLLGVFLMPSTAIACGNSEAAVPKKECAKEKNDSEKSTKSDCCKKDSKTKNSKKTCDGKCGHSTCATSSVSAMAYLVFETLIPMNSFYFTNGRPNLYSNTGNLSNGYSSLWLIPKIG